MSEAPTAPQSPPPPDPPPVPRRLTRSSSDKVMAGVAGGLGRYFDIDPIIFRIGFVVLDPRRRRRRARLPRRLGARARGPGAGAGARPTAAAPRRSPARSCSARRDRAARPRAVLPRPAADRLGADRARRRPAVARGRRQSTAAPRPPRSGSRLLLIVVAALGFVAVAFGAALGRRRGDRRPRDRARRRAGRRPRSSAARRWLVAARARARDPARLRRGRRARPQRRRRRAQLPADHAWPSCDDGYELGIGEMRVDLRDVDLPPGRTPLKLDMGIGSVRLLVPDDVCVASTCSVGAGYARVLDRDSGGLDVDWRQSPVAGRRRQAPGDRRRRRHRRAAGDQRPVGLHRLGRQRSTTLRPQFDFGRNRIADLSPGVDANAACKEAA